MAMTAPDAFTPEDDLEALRRDNETLRQQVQALSAQQTVARGAIQEAVHQKTATVRIAHQMGVEERATRAAVDEQTASTNFTMILQVVNLALTIVLLIGLFFWLPRAIPQPAPTIVTSPAGATYIPGR